MGSYLFMKLRGRLCLLCGYLFFFQVLIIGAQVGIVDRNAKVKPTFVLLGTYHMGNEGNNTFKSDVDDVTSPKRQKQVAELLAKLEKYKPTKINFEKEVYFYSILGCVFNISYFLPFGIHFN